MRCSSLVAVMLVSLCTYTAAEEQVPKETEKPLPALKVGEKPVVLFNGKNLEGWRVLKEDFFDKPGEVSVKEGTILLAAGKPATGIALASAPPRINYEISLEAQRTGGDDFFCGLTFPVQKEYCTLIVGGWGGGVIGLSNINGSSAVENETTAYHEFKNNQWYKIRLRVTDGQISAWLDDEQVVDLKTMDRKFSIWWEQEPARPLGIATWNTSSALRNISLKTVKAEPKP